MCCLRSVCLPCPPSSSSISQLAGWKGAREVGPTLVSNSHFPPVPDTNSQAVPHIPTPARINMQCGRVSEHTFLLPCSESSMQGRDEVGLSTHKRTRRWLLVLGDLQLASTGYINQISTCMSSHWKRWVCTPEKEEKRVNIKQSTDHVTDIEAICTSHIISNCIYTTGPVTTWSQPLPRMSLVSTQHSHGTATSLPQTQFSYRYSKFGFLWVVWRDQFQAIRDAVVCAAGIMITSIW